MAVDPNWKDNPDIKKMFAGGLSTDTTDETFLEYFQKYGPIEKAEIVRDNNRASRGFGFVSFENCDDLDRCLADRPHKIDNKEIDIKRAIPKNDTTQTATLRTRKLFVGGLREDCTQSGISEALESICGIKPSDVQLMKDRNTDKFRGFAFALFDNEDIVDKLYIIRSAVICSRKVDMKKAEERGKGGGGGFRGGRGGRGGHGGGGGGGYGGGGGGYGGGGTWGGYPASGGYGSGYGGGYEYDGGYDAGNYYGYGYGASGYGGAGRESYMGSYTQESSGFGPSSRGRGRGGRMRGGGGGGGYSPY